MDVVSTEVSGPSITKTQTLETIRDDGGVVKENFLFGLDYEVVRTEWTYRVSLNLSMVKLLHSMLVTLVHVLKYHLNSGFPVH